MRRLVVFNNITLDGYFAATNGDIGWAHGTADPEFDAFVADNAGAGGQLLLGRTTYELMAGYWPTPLASQNAPVVAERMNQMPKVVFSRTMDTAWSNTTVVKGDLAAAVRRMKNESGPGMAILGSGSIVSQLAQEGLIDEYQLVVNPVVLGRGRTLFDGIATRLALKLTKSRVFRHGKVFLCCEPMA
ncbi:MAG: dihydrofolate reductase family protein [Gemmatimonadales bacterium]